MDIARKYGAEEVIYDNATNEQYLKDVANGRTDVILNDYYLQKLALAAMPDLDLTIHPDFKYYPHQQGLIMKKGIPGSKNNLTKLSRICSKTVRLRRYQKHSLAVPMFQKNRISTLLMSM